MQTFIRNTSML